MDYRNRVDFYTKINYAYIDTGQIYIDEMMHSIWQVTETKREVRNHE